MPEPRVIGGMFSLLCGIDGCYATTTSPCSHFTPQNSELDRLGVDMMIIVRKARDSHPTTPSHTWQGRKIPRKARTGGLGPLARRYSKQRTGRKIYPEEAEIYRHTRGDLPFSLRSRKEGWPWRKIHPLSPDSIARLLGVWDFTTGQWLRDSTGRIVPRSELLQKPHAQAGNMKEPEPEWFSALRDRSLETPHTEPFDNYSRVPEGAWPSSADAQGYDAEMQARRRAARRGSVGVVRRQ